MTPVPADASHSSASDISAYLDQTLSEGDHKRVETHLATCSECREEVVELSRLLRSYPRRRPLLHWAMAAGIAATLALMLGRVPWIDEAKHLTGPVEQIERGARPEEDHRLSAWTPAKGVPHHRDSLILTWGAAQGSRVQYRATLSTSDGQVLWTASTPDTMLVPPRSLDLRKGETFYWYTDAILPDGRTLTTGVQEFRMAR